jgi:hypothetical protein
VFGGESLKSKPILWSIAGDTGEGAREWFKFLLMKDFQLPHLKILFPTAPQRPYTPLGGEVREYVAGKIILERSGSKF